MAVVIASALDKDMAGSPLFRGVSFKLERGDRMTLAGRNGAGKTTLLRMVSGETGIDGGELVFEKGTGVALHDQRPPRERDLTLRDYVLSGCSYLVSLEAELRRLEGDMAERPDDGTLLDRYSRAQGRLEHAGGWDWRNRALGPSTGSASPPSSSTESCPPSRAGSSRAPRWRGRWPATPTCCCSTSRRTTST